VEKGMKRQVIKHSSAIQIASTEGDITLIQRKAYNVLLACAYNDLPTKTVHHMPLNVLCRYLNFESNNTKYLKEALKGLVGTNVEWNILGADRQQEWGTAALLSEVKIKNGLCYWEYPSTLRQMLYNPRIFARINLSLQNKISSKHSLILYENIFFYYRAADGCGETPWIEILLLRKLLGIKPEEYKQFKVFNNSVIKKSVEEINQKTDLQVTIEYKRKGRKVAAIKFHVELNEEKEEIKDSGSLDKNNLHHRLVNDYGIEVEQAKELLEKHDPATIAENLVIVDMDKASGKIKDSLAGYAITAIKHDFRKDRKPVNKTIPMYEGMRIIYKGKEYVLDACMSIRLDQNTILPEGVIYNKIQSREIRVLELLLFPGVKLLINGNVCTIKNSFGEAVINEDGLYLSEKELKSGIKSRKYTIMEYPDIDS
jgi:plasmid replication initiation protein